MLSYLVRCSNCYLFQIFPVWFRKRQCYLIWSDALIAIFFRYLQFGSERDNAILFGSDALITIFFRYLQFGSERDNSEPNKIALSLSEPNKIALSLSEPNKIALSLSEPNCKYLKKIAIRASDQIR
jgi:hypothetical protein